MRNLDGFVDGYFTWFIGEIEDISDPDKMNRVRVRAYGYHENNKSKLATADLPWATVMMPTTSASYKGIGSNHELMVGSWVVGFFRDGPSAQDPIVMGSIATQTEDVIDIPVEAQLNPPTNKVHKTEAGHFIEFDNTTDAERINIQHKSGTTININKDGTVEINSSNTTVNIIGNTTITGKLDVSGEVTAKYNTEGESVTLTGHNHTGSATAPLGAVSDTGDPKGGT